MLHLRRVLAARASLTDRATFARGLNRTSAATAGMLSLPGLCGVVAAWAGSLETAAVLLLTGVFALCLVLVAYRRPWLAALLVWGPALVLLGGWDTGPVALGAATAAGLPAAGAALRTWRSYG